MSLLQGFLKSHVNRTNEITPRPENLKTVSTGAIAMVEVSLLDPADWGRYLAVTITVLGTVIVVRDSAFIRRGRCWVR
jgi:hypothetical protein